MRPSPHRHRASILFILCVALGACYPHVGRRPSSLGDADALAARAREACARRDPAAAAHLYERLNELHPDHPEAALSRRPDPCLPHTDDTTP